MKINIKLIGSFRTGRFNEAVHEYQSAKCVQEVIDELVIPNSLLGIVLINDIRARVDDLIIDGDTLCLLPFIDGG